MSEPRTMSNKTRIAWTQMTWNPTTGCDRVSPGCDHCYALTMAKRLKGMGSRRYQGDGHPISSGPGFGLTLHEDALSHPFTWRDPRLVFVDSMSDLFHDAVPLSFLTQVFEVMERTPQHTYQILTKRSRRLRRLSSELPWPPNVWMGVSVEDQARAYRAGNLMGVPATVRFVSAEPLLGPLDLHECLGPISWAIAGGESGSGARSCDLDWLRSLRDQCRQTGVGFFLKQLGGHPNKRAHDAAVLDGQCWTQMPRRIPR